MTRFKMLGKDLNSSPLQYRTWVVPNTPDYDGYYYDGPKSGSTPLGNISAYELNDDNIIADFSLPNPLSWSNTRLTISEEMHSSQLAIVDGYIYLFGGSDGYGNKILRATVDNPADWEDTHATLPSNLYGSQAAVIDGYVYLFGGNNGSATNHIYSAPTSNPLNWTDRGALLPKKVFNSQLLVMDGYVYLFGGKGDGYVYNSILRSTVANPLSWTTSGTLPEAVYGSTLGIIYGDSDGYICLYGGIGIDGYSMSKIYSTPLSNLSSWSIAGNLPYPISYGQFVTVGLYSFIFAAANSNATSFTYILRTNGNPFLWYDFGFKIPGTVVQSQLAIVNDRLFLFGGNANTTIYADNPYIKYNVFDPNAIEYGTTTRTDFNAAPVNNRFKVIGIAPWKTTYGS
jgi:hypothetical protein